MSQRPVLTAFLLSALFVVLCRLPSLARPIWNLDEGLTAVTANVLLKAASISRLRRSARTGDLLRLRPGVRAGRQE